MELQAAARKSTPWDYLTYFQKSEAAFQRVIAKKYYTSYKKYKKYRIEANNWKTQYLCSYLWHNNFMVELTVFIDDTEDASAAKFKQGNTLKDRKSEIHTNLEPNYF